MTRRLPRIAVALSVGGILALLAARAVSHHLPTQVPECAGPRALDFDCFAARYETMTRSRGPKSALDDLAARRPASSVLVAGCHQLTHVIGRAAGEMHGQAAFTQGSDVCASGYYHGVIESVMTRMGASRIRGEALGVCAEYRERHYKTYLHYNCAHGMGHGFMAVYASDVFQSLAACDTLPTPWEQHHCYGGVFMENLTARGHASRPATHLRPHEPLYPCTAVADKYKGDCYMKQTAYALSVRNDDFAAVFRLCRDTADARFRAVCYQGLGGDAAIIRAKSVIGDAAQSATVRNLCLQGPDTEARTNCVAGAVTTIVRDLGGDNGKVATLCAAIGDELQSACDAARERASRGVPPPEGNHHHGG